MVNNITLQDYVEAQRPIIYINHFDFNDVDRHIRKILESEKKAKCFEYNAAIGVVDFKTKSEENPCNLEEFLRTTMGCGFDCKTFLILKGVHQELNNPAITYLLKRIAENISHNDYYDATVFIISESTIIPKELEDYITIYDISLPGEDKITEIINNFCEETDISGENIPELTMSFKGLNEYQIREILILAFQQNGAIGNSAASLIMQEKQQLLKKSGMLEIVNFKETINDIGGLELLKVWLYRKSVIIKNLDKAIKCHVDIPKGIMLVGMPGCGKSLAAKATASLFELPLIRLDIGNLLGKYVGESEENMRKALKLAEAISPCVLWIDEIEKAFAGVGGEGGGNDVTTRLFGHFLTWMQEKESTVFVVATANDISKIPPEFLRKGRFDEIFFIDLPNNDERKKILEIHLKKRKQFNGDINLDEVVKKTVGYNGADLESIVNETIESAFIEAIYKQENGQPKISITTKDLLNTISTSKSISATLKDKLAKIKETVKNMEIKSASL